MAAEDVKICSNALILIGANPINSFIDGTTEASIAKALYADVRNSLLEAHPWKFTNSKSGPLSKLSSSPLNEYDYAYQLPADYSNLRKISLGSIEYDIYEDSRVYTNYDGEIFIDYQAKPNEEKFPPHFRLLLMFKLASVFAIPVRESVSLADEWEKKHQVQFKMSRRVDSSQVSSKITTKGFSLVNVR